MNYQEDTQECFWGTLPCSTSFIVMAILFLISGLSGWCHHNPSACMTVTSPAPARRRTDHGDARSASFSRSGRHQVRDQQPPVGGNRGYLWAGLVEAAFCAAAWSARGQLRDSGADSVEKVFVG